MQNNNDSWLALDVGNRRIGLAIANVFAKLPNPLTSIENDSSTDQVLTDIIKQNSIIGIVVGLPRNLSGLETPQSQTVRQFMEKLKSSLTVPIYWQDETLSTKMAESIAKEMNLKNPDLDAVAAVVILRDFLADHPEAGK